MGMYDTVEVHSSFPLPEYPPTAHRGTFQTKDLDADNLTFLVDAEGQLLLRSQHEDAVSGPYFVYKTLTIYTSVGDCNLAEWFQYTLHFCPARRRFTHATRDQR